MTHLYMIQRYRDTDIHWYRDADIQRYRDTGSGVDSSQDCSREGLCPVWDTDQ